MQVSVIICCSRQSAYATIQSVKEQTYPAQIIVIDDASNPALRIECPEIIYIRNAKPKGLSFCRNLGIARASGEIVAFIDDDALADKNWIKELVNGFKESTQIIGGFIEPRWQATPPFWLTGRFYHLIASHHIPTQQIIFGCNFAVRKSLLEELNFKFREELGRRVNNLIAGDEMDLLFQAFKMRRELIFNPQAKVFHLIPTERLKFCYFLRRSFWEGRTFSRYGNVSIFYFYSCKNLFSAYKDFVLKFKFVDLREWCILDIETLFVLLGIAGSIWEIIMGAQDYESISG